jgi:hypothetical protein
VNAKIMPTSMKTALAATACKNPFFKENEGRAIMTTRCIMSLLAAAPAAELRSEPDE